MDDAVLFFLHPGSQLRAGMPACLPVYSAPPALHGRFRFARAGQHRGCPVLLPGMLVRRAVHGMQGAREKQQAVAVPLRRVALTRTPCAGMRSFRMGQPMIKVSAARPQGKRCAGTAATERSIVSERCMPARRSDEPPKQPDHMPERGSISTINPLSMEKARK